MVEVVLVDKSGKELGTMEKLEAHRNPGKLHKAVSVVLYRPTSRKASRGEKETLLQKRAEIKPLWPGYWANTVCTHPLPGESNLDCAVRRLKEELGIEMEIKKLKELYTFKYQVDYNEEYSEHELDTVILGEWDPSSHKASRGETTIKINRDEVSEVKWMEWEELKKDMKERPEIYASWAKIIFREKRLMKHLNDLGDIPD